MSNQCDHQHILPRWYQKAWEDAQRRVYHYNLAIGANQKNFCYALKSTKGIGAQDYAYEADVENPTYIFDNAYTDFENWVQADYLKMLRNLSYAPRYRLTRNERLLLCQVVTNLLVREVDNVAHNYLTDIMTARFTLGLSDKAIERRWINLCIMSPDGPMQHDWQFVLLNSAITLYKFNNPCVMYTNVIYQDVKQHRTYLPLSPYMLVVFDAYGPYDSCIRYNFGYDKLLASYLTDSRIKDFYAASPNALHAIVPDKPLA
jgi:hypothetical protein